MESDNGIDILEYMLYTLHVGVVASRGMTLQVANLARIKVHIVSLYCIIIEIVGNVRKFVVRYRKMTVGHEIIAANVIY